MSDSLKYVITKNIGIYGTRNVCQKAVDSGAVTNCFVSDMSTGFSGNLGFAMPKEWAFDQFYEHSNLGFPIDNVAVSGRDFGTKHFNTPNESIVQYHATQLLKKLKWDMFIKDVGFSLDTEYHIQPAPSVDVYVKAESSWKVANNKAGYSIIVSNGKVDKVKYSDPLQAELQKFNDITKLQGNDQMDKFTNELAPVIGNGVIETGVCARDGKFGLKFIVKKEVEETIEGHTIKSDLELTAEIYVTPLLPSPIPDPKYKEIYNYVTEVETNINWGGIALGVGAVALATVAIVAAIVFAPVEGLMALGSGFLLLLSQI